MRILVTDGLQRKTLSVVRSLGRAGDQLFVAEYSKINPSAMSKFAYMTLKSPNPSEHPKIYLEWLIEVLDTYKIEIFIPMDDAAMSIAVKHQAEIKEVTKLLVPALEDYIAASDKGRVLKYAKEAGLDYPRTLFPESDEALEAISSNIPYPALIKPRHLSGSRGIRKVDDSKALLRRVNECIMKSGEFPLIQTYLPQGEKYDVCLIFDEDGNRKSAFVQREVRQFPEPMGPSTLQVSVQHQDLIDQGERLMRLLHWKGVVEVEFMRNPLDGKFYFMEVNTRFWASLQCAVFSGVDFPKGYRQLALDQPFEDTGYQEGIMCRWLFPGDFLRFVFYRGKVPWVPGLFAGKKAGVRDDIYDKEDPKPLWGVFLAALRYAFDPKMWRMLIWR